MTGVEILAMEEVVTEFSFCWLAFWIAFGVTLMLCVGSGILFSNSTNDWSYLVLLVLAGLFMGALFATLFGTLFETPIEYETQYKVIVSDGVPMNDFLDKYEIIDQEGKIYTVRERNG